MTNTKLIERKVTYRVVYDYPTIKGNKRVGTKWYNSADEIPENYFLKGNAILIERSYNIYERPSLEDFKKHIAEGNKYWLNTNEVIREVEIA